MADELSQHLALFAFEGIEFPGADVSTTFGHDSAKHKGYGQRGADVETTGPKEKVVKVRAVLVNGLRGWRGDALFPTVFQRLTRALETTPEGLLTHPTRGVVTVHFDEGVEEIRAPERRGVTLMLSFTEQRGESELLEFGPNAVTTSPAERVTAAAAAADAAALDLLGRVMGYVDAAQAFVDDLRDGTAQAATIMASADGLVTRIRGDLRDPLFAAADLHPLREAQWAFLAATYEARDKALGDEARTYTVAEPASLAMIASLPEVYGDASRASDLAASNSIVDPSLVPEGTVLRVVD